MSKRKWVKLLISHRWGNQSNCSHHTDRAASYVVHESFAPLDLRDYYRQYGEQEFPRAQQREMRKTHPKQADERFLCMECYKELKNNGMRYDIETGQADFTSIEVERWKEREYRTVEEAVQDFLIKQKSS